VAYCTQPVANATCPLMLVPTIDKVKSEMVLPWTVGADNHFGKADAVKAEPSVDARRSTPQMQRVPTTKTHEDCTKSGVWLKVGALTEITFSPYPCWLQRQLQIGSLVDTACQQPSRRRPA